MADTLETLEIEGQSTRGPLAARHARKMESTTQPLSKRARLRLEKRLDGLHQEIHEGRSRRFRVGKIKPTRQNRAMVTRKDGSQRRRLTVYLPPTTFRELSFHCFDLEQNISDVVTEAVEQWLDSMQ